jgi:GT2 family glycosyltransferase
MAVTPTVSVIIPSYQAKETIRDCLESLRAQSAVGDFEVILVDSSLDGTHRLVEREFPEVRTFHSEKRKYCGDARNIGLSISKGAIIAQIDADCRAAPDWIEKIITAHESEYPAIGGAIANGNPESMVGWAAYFCEFSQWMPGQPAGWMTDIAGANMTYKRRLLHCHGPFIEGTYGSDTAFHWRLRRAGIRIRFDSSILVYHRNLSRLGTYLKHEYLHGHDFAAEYLHGHDFAAVRKTHQHMTKLKRALFGLGVLPLCLKIFTDRVRQNLSNRVYLGQFLKALPFLIAGIFCWSLGESRAYLDSTSGRRYIG